MNTLLSLVYGQAGLCAAVIALAYACLALQNRCKRSLSPMSKPMFWVLLAVALAHTLLLAASIWTAHDFGASVLNLGFAQALSLAMCVGVWLYIIESYWLLRAGLSGIDGLRPLALGFPAMAVALSAVIAPVPVVLSNGAALHVLVAIAAHGVALLACGHGVLLLALNRVLKKGVSTGWALRLAQQSPPLVVLERLVIRLSAWVAGLLALTVGLGLLGGVLKFDHKTVLTVASLLVWLEVPWGYSKRGWRASKLCAAVLVATGLLLLAYIGSRFVLQALLHR